MIQLIALFPSQCIDSGDIKYIRNRCNLSLFWVSEDCWLCNVAILE